MTERIHILYFSPTGGTRRVARMLLSGLRAEGIPVEETNLTPFEARRRRRTYGPGDLVFFLTPVYYGRVALPLQDLSSLTGAGAAAVPVAVFGNREYDDALREAARLLTERGFVTVAGAAFVAQHSQWPALGAERPDDRDRTEIERFAKAVLAKLRELGSPEAARVTLPGVGDETPLKPYLPTPAAPMVAHPERCHQCGDCVEHCPMDIIDPMSFVVTDPKACILCRACIAHCPDGARDLPEPARSAVAQRMEQIFLANLARKEPSVFLD